MKREEGDRKKKGEEGSSRREIVLQAEKMSFGKRPSFWTRGGRRDRNPEDREEN